MAEQGDEIKKWAKSQNPLLSLVCLEIMDAAKSSETK
jgi:hypothetical protein